MYLVSPLPVQASHDPRADLHEGGQLRPGGGQGGGRGLLPALLQHGGRAPVGAQTQVLVVAVRAGTWAWATTRHSVIGGILLQLNGLRTLYKSTQYGGISIQYTYCLLTNICFKSFCMYYNASVNNTQPYVTMERWK